MANKFSNHMNLTIHLKNMTIHIYMCITSLATEKDPQKDEPLFSSNNITCKC